MRWIDKALFLTLVLAGAACLRAMPAAAQDPDDVARPRVHGPAHITVHPLRSYPGPNAVRQCAFWLATEYRPSGTVITPQQHCWWERG